MAEGDLNHHSSGRENQSMFVFAVFVVAERCREGVPRFEAGVDVLMTSKDVRTHFHLLRTLSQLLSLDIPRAHRLVPVVRFDPFECVELVYKLFLKDDEVRVISRLEWPIDPDDIARPDAQGHLVSESRAMELERIVRLRQWGGLHDAKVGSIDGDKTIVSNVIDVAILPNNLEWAQ